MELTYENGAAIPNRLTKNPASTVVSGWYDQYGTDVLRLCFMYMRNRLDAEDATQETLLKVWRKLDCFEARNHCSARSWIMRVACNTCKDMLRKSWRKHEDRSVTPEDLSALGDSSREDRELMMDVMNLPEKYRSVILMVYWQGMTMKEASETLRLSQSTICRRLEKARSMIDG
ncbi:MAG: sigma-70 family RNA polymerase sigma factor [Erysipelotrichaceae bacterium]|nr:sigma-70 family RNA polymerase sigma factor [Erysipelotrichaceae bacterium]MBQ6483190.1 sigma-70 family RNA polymerase sigma factor [Anaerolineaceae bacterium]MBR0342186.1 sigma-70 family RNA polymerase sigma factor [Oscillospiraceae bacterium]